MSAINVILHSDAVHFLSDIGAWSASERMMLPTELAKCLPVPHLRCAIAARGSAAAVMMAQMELSAAGADLDALEQAAPAVLRAMDESCAHLWSLSGTPAPWQVIVAGISPSRGPCGFAIANHKSFAEAFATVTLPPLAVSPGDESLTEWIGQKFAFAETADDIDPEIHGAWLAHEQTQREFSPFGEDFMMRMVSDRFQLTTITGDMITCRMIDVRPAP